MAYGFRAVTYALTLALSLTACSQSGGGEKLTGTDRFTFTPINGGKAYSVSAGTAIKGAVNIPAWYRPNAGSDYLPVTAIANNAFAYCTGITSITIPEGVTYISGGAFGKCTGLTGITIPASVAWIGIIAFADCTGITSVTIPAGVTLIDGGAFIGWTAAQTINIEGKANREATITAWWDEGWDIGCDATIVYDK
jgi:hypothetical protein